MNAFPTIKKLLNRVWLPILVLLGWQNVAIHLDNIYLPSVTEILYSLSELFQNGSFLLSLNESLKTIFVGYFIGSFLGILIGCCLGLNSSSKAIFLPIANFLRGIPSVAKVPVFIAIFGIGSLTRITTVATAVFFVLLISTIDGLSGPSKEHLELSRMMHLNRMQFIFRVAIPSAYPKIFAGLHVALQISILVMIVSEMLGSSLGIGAYIFRAQATFNISQMWNGLFILGSLGMLLNILFLKIERRFLRWNPKVRQDY